MPLHRSPERSSLPTSPISEELFTPSNTDSSASGHLQGQQDAYELQQFERRGAEKAATSGGFRGTDSNPGLRDTAAEQWRSAGPQEKEVLLSYTAEEEAVVLRKLDRHLVLFLAILYMLSFLDRSSKVSVTTRSERLNQLQTSAMRRSPALLTI